MTRPTLHLPDAVLIDDCWYAVRDGDWPKLCYHPDPTECNGEHCDCPLRPPSEWSGLDTCQTCDGIGIRYVDKYGAIWGNTLADQLGLTDKIPCPDCVGGVPLVTITVPCQTCEGHGGYLVEADGDTLRHGHCRRCGTGSEGGGTVSFPATATVSPVYGSDDLPDNDSIPCIEVNPFGEVWLHRDGYGWERSLDRKGLVLDVRPGQFVLEATPHPQETSAEHD